MRREKESAMHERYGKGEKSERNRHDELIWQLEGQSREPWTAQSHSLKKLARDNKSSIPSIKIFRNSVNI
jgi:hypothetical protein